MPDHTPPIPLFSSYLYQSHTPDPTSCPSAHPVQIFVSSPDADTREALLFVDLVGREAALGVGDIEALVRCVEVLGEAISGGFECPRHLFG